MKCCKRIALFVCYFLIIPSAYNASVGLPANTPEHDPGAKPYVLGIVGRVTQGHPAYYLIYYLNSTFTQM
jgi:hypothetical protein